MGIAALSCFGNVLGEEFNAQTLEHVLRLAIVEFVKFFIGFYFLVFLLKEILPYFSGVREKEHIERFVGSLLALYMTVDIVVNILPKGFSFLEYAVLGIFYVIWTGAKAANIYAYRYNYRSGRTYYRRAYSLFDDARYKQIK